MAEKKIKSDENGIYWLEMEIVGEKKKMQWDPGFNGAISVNEANWNKIKGKLTDRAEGSGTDAEGEESQFDSGKGKVRIADFGPEVEKRIIWIKRGGSDLVGTEFFHNLKGYELLWDFDKKEITIRKKVEIKKYRGKPVKFGLRTKFKHQDVS